MHGLFQTVPCSNSFGSVGPVTFTLLHTENEIVTLNGKRTSCTNLPIHHCLLATSTTGNVALCGCDVFRAWKLIWALRVWKRYCAIGRRKKCPSVVGTGAALFAKMMPALCCAVVVPACAARGASGGHGRSARWGRMLFRCEECAPLVHAEFG